MKATRKLSLDTFDPTLYLDRNMSLLAFNARVLAQAENGIHLLGRMKKKGALLPK